MVRRCVIVLVAGFIALPGTVCAEAPLRVAYEVEAVVGSWQPFLPRDLVPVVEHAVLEVLSRPGLLQLVRAARSRSTVERGAPASDYQLRVQSRILDEAETHSVYLMFGPGRRNDVPSVHASATVVLSRLRRDAMLERIQLSARQAARRLLDALRGPIAAARGQAGAVEVAAKAQTVSPWQWPEVRVPRPSASRAASELDGQDHSTREAALRVLASLARVEASPRHVLERCALGHEEPRMRLGCLIALRPLSRRLEPTRRVVIEAYRRGPTRRIREEASEQMLYFADIAQAEAIQAWIEGVGEGWPAGPLKSLGDLPNLDRAIHRCLYHGGKRRRPGRDPRRTCLGLLEPLSHRRRRAILWRFVRETDPASPYYLRGVGKRERSIGTVWEVAIEALVERARRWDPKLEAVLWRRYQRDMSYSAVSMLADYGAPSRRLAQHLFEIVQTSGEWRALSGLRRIGGADAKLGQWVRDKLREMVELGSYPKQLSRRRIERVIAELDKNANQREGKEQRR